MKRACISALGLFAFANVALADTTFTNGNGNNNWNDAGNWSAGVPDATDLVTIPANLLCIVNVTGAVADRLSIASTGELRIASGKDLTLDNTPSGTGSVVNGTLSLKTVSGTGAVLRIIDNDHPFSGSGTIVGDDTNSKIQIEQGIAFKNQMTMGGSYKVERDDSYGTSSPAYFHNYNSSNAGTVQANSGKTVQFASSVNLADLGASFWIANAGTIQFDAAATGLGGTFRVLSCGTFVVNANIATCGQFKWNGTVDVNNGATFKYGSFDASSPCGNPGSAALGACLGMKEITTDSTCCP
jgi:hypothetical protein